MDTAEQVFKQFSGGDDSISVSDLRKVIEALDDPRITDIDEQVKV